MPTSNETTTAISSWAVAIPLANEEETLETLVTTLKEVLDATPRGAVYFVVDKLSVDATREICEKASKVDSRFNLVWAPECRSVVDAYLTGFRHALKSGADFIIEMDAGFSHDPRDIPKFIQALQEGVDVAWGSRVTTGGKFKDVPWKRRLLSWLGTTCSKIFLGTSLTDSTSGYEAFKAPVCKKLLEYKLLSRAHFYQTEVRYLLRNFSYKEIGIVYSSPSPRVSKSAIKNSVSVLWYYTVRRLQGKALEIFS